MSWWDIKARDPFVVCAEVGHRAEEAASAPLNGKSFDLFAELSQKQRDDIMFAAFWCSSGTYQMAGMTYRLLHERTRWHRAAIGLTFLNTLLLIALLLR
jgi:hypothetical protein